MPPLLAPRVRGRWISSDRTINVRSECVVHLREVWAGTTPFAERLLCYQNNKKEMLAMMKTLKTRQKIRVENFYRTHCNESDPSSALIGAALLSVAERYRPNAFSTLKSQVVADQLERGRPYAAEEIRSLINPVTAPDSSLTRKPKTPTVKKVSKEDTDELFKHLLFEGHKDEAAALLLARFLGVRPCEMRTITISGDEIHIVGGKKSAPLHRGADRIVVIENSKVFKAIAWAARRMKHCDRTDTAIRDRFRNECRALWPRRKKHPTLKSFRHNFSSTLKAVGGDPKTTAYLMGHQSEESHSVYGDRRSGEGQQISIKPSTDADLSTIRTPKKPPRFGKLGTVVGEIVTPGTPREHWSKRLPRHRSRGVEN